MIRQELNQFVADLLAKGFSTGWIGLELMTMGMGMLTTTMGPRKMAEHFRYIAEQFEINSQRAERDDGYSSFG